MLTGHSCGACLAAQAVLGGPGRFGLGDVGEAPRPVALVGLNGLYDLPTLVDGLGPSHEHMRAEYAMLLSNAFGPDDATWPAASPARFAADEVALRVRSGAAPRVVLLDQSPEDQLVPMNQRDRMASHLALVPGLEVVDGHRCTGVHAAPWQQGHMIWESVLDVLRRT